MKKLLLILSILLIGCRQNENSKNTITSDSGIHYKIVLIENCEYIVYENSLALANNYSFAITHKGNCKNHANN